MHEEEKKKRNEAEQYQRNIRETNQVSDQYATSTVAYDKPTQFSIERELVSRRYKLQEELQLIEDTLSMWNDDVEKALKVAHNLEKLGINQWNLRR